MTAEPSTDGPPEPEPGNDISEAEESEDDPDEWEPETDPIRPISIPHDVRRDRDPSAVRLPPMPSLT
jgi:hypothetical protein